MITAFPVLPGGDQAVNGTGSAVGGEGVVEDGDSTLIYSDIRRKLSNLASEVG